MDRIDRLAKAVAVRDILKGSRLGRRTFLRWTSRLGLGAFVATPFIASEVDEAAAACSFNVTIANSYRTVLADALNCRSGPSTSCSVLEVRYCGEEFRTVGYTSGQAVTNCCGTTDSRWYSVELKSDPNFACFMSRAWTSYFGCDCCGVPFTGSDGEVIPVG